MEVAKVLEAIWRGRSREPASSYFQHVGAALTFLDTGVYTGALKSNGIPRGPCSRKGEIGWIVREKWGRGSGRIWTHAPGATRGSRSVITSASLVLSPSYHYSRAYHPLDLLHVHTRRTRVPLTRGEGRRRGMMPGSTCTHMIALVEVHANSGCKGMGLHYVGVSTNTHARLSAREARVSWREGIDPCTPHAFARPPLLLHTRHTSA